jgi:flagellar hook-associated protein 1 FlgK
MSDMMSIGVSALQAYSQSLNTVSNNIANANTTGYSSEQTVLQNNVNGGVTVQQVQRLTNTMLFSNNLANSASYSQVNTFQTYASNVDTLMSQTQTGLAQPLQAFYTAVSAVSANPQDATARQSMLAAAGSLTSTFNSLQSQLTGMQANVNTQLSQSVTQVNQYAASIAQLNGQIALASGSGQQPNSLLDQRDQLLTQLSQQVGISTVTQSNGTVNVFTAGGQALVVGGTSQALSLVPNSYDSSQMEVAIGQPPANINSQISGGAIGGLITTRSQLLDPTLASLGQVAAAVTQSVNAQNAQGVDLNGNPGANIFAPLSATVLGSSANQGSASVSASLQDISQVPSGNYTLKYNGTQWSLTQAATGVSVPMTGAGTAASPFVANGLSIQVSGAAAAGDSYLIEPTQNAAGQMQVVMTNPSQIAAAAPVTTTAASSNTGSGSIALSAITDSSNPNLFAPVTLQFTSANTYSINGSGSYAYTPGAAISMNGWSAAISGTPASGDSFQVTQTTANSGDNTNANLMAALATQGILNGGTTSASAANTALVTQTGSIAQQATLSSASAQAIQTQGQQNLSAVSGVNLDQQAASLVQYQQAYQAAAQIISSAQTMFQTLLDATKGS